MIRRAYATFMKKWPGNEVELLLTSPQISFEEYVVNAGEEEQDKIINILVGDLQRIKVYPRKGFQIEQEIPDQVWRAFEELVQMGYIKHLINE